MRNIIVTFFMFACCNGFSQQVNKISEKEFEVLREKTENAAIVNTDSALVFYKNLCNIYGANISTKNKAKLFNTFSLIKIWQTQLDDALKYNNISLFLNQKENNLKEIAKNYSIYGTIYQHKTDYISSISYFLKSNEIATKEKLYHLIQRNYRSLSNISNRQEEYSKGKDYAEKAIKMEKNQKNIINKADNLVALGFCYLNENNFEKALIVFKQSENIYFEKKEHFRLATLKASKSLIYDNSNPIYSAELNFESHAILDKIAPNNLITIAIKANLGSSYFELAKNDSLISMLKKSLIPNTKSVLLQNAEALLKKSLVLSIKNKNNAYIISFSNMLQDLQNYLGDYKNAYENLSLSTRVKDSLFSQKNKNAIAKLESEKEVFELKTANEKKSTLNKILIGSSIGLLLISFLGYRNFRNKRKLQNQKISELEKDKQLLAIDAMLKGQEEERSRIAKDLHDGLGGLLSGTKLSFTNMKENLLLTPENAILFEKSIGMLDTTIADLRKVAHNLMPEALVKFGLNDALNDFCSSIQLASNIKVDYQKIGIDRKIGNTAETFIYRIIQELVNNAVKHAEAKEILVQVAFTNNKIIVTVEDNGKGYDKNLASTGDGLDNIAYRIKYLSGTIDTVTSPNNGTSVNIELNV